MTDDDKKKKMNESTKAPSRPKSPDLLSVPFVNKEIGVYESKQPTASDTRCWMEKIRYPEALLIPAGILSLCRRK